MRAGGGAATSAGPAWGGDGPGVPAGGPGGSAAATLDARRALPVDRPSCGGRFSPAPPWFAGAGGRGRRAPSAGRSRPRGAAARSPLSLRRRGPRRGVPGRTAPRLGRRLAADLELVRTRGIRLFN